MNDKEKKDKLEILDSQIEHLRDMLHMGLGQAIYKDLVGKIHNLEMERMGIVAPEALQRIKDLEIRERYKAEENEEDKWGDGDEELDNDMPEKWESKSGSPVWFDEAYKIPTRAWNELKGALTPLIKQDMSPEEKYNYQMKAYGIQNFVWVEDEPTNFVFESRNFSVKYEKTGESDIIFKGNCLWQYKAKEVKFN